MSEDKVYDVDNLPEDAEVITKGKEFDPIDASEMYQAEVFWIDLRDNIFHKPNAEKPEDRGSKYQFNFEYAIIDEGKYYGRRIWDTTSLVFKPDGKRGPTKLYKIVSAASKTQPTILDCAEIAPDMKTFYKYLKENVEGKQVRVAIENITNPETKKVRTKVVTYYEVKKELPAFDADKKAEEGVETKKASKKKDVEASSDLPF